MNFLGPAMLAGLVALGLPIAAHLLGRRKPEPIPFAALRFLQAREPQVARRRRLRDLPLLGTRVLIWLLLALALARPVTLSDAAVSVYGEAHDAVLLVDSSASMQLRRDGQRELDRSYAQARELVDALPPDSRFAWMVSDPDGPREGLGPATLERIDRLEAWLKDDPPPIGRRLSDALDEALATLGPDEGRPRVVYVLADPTANGLGSLPSTLADGVVMVPISTREIETPVPAHLGLGAPSWSPAPELDPRAVRIEVPVRRFGGEESLEVGVALEIDGNPVGQGRTLLAPDGEGAVEFTHTLANAADAARARVRILDREDDALWTDDAREFWISGRERLRVALVNGDPSERREFDELFFVATAIDAGDPDGKIEVRGLVPDQLERAVTEGDDPFEDLDVVVLANVAAPSPALAAALERRVEEGMGLWVGVGDRVTAQAYDEVLDDLLPLRLRDASFAGTAPGRTEARVEGMSPAKLSHPIFTGLEREPDLSAARTRRLFLLEPDATRETDVALAFASGAPALISRTHGRGRVVLLTTSFDRDWSDLALRPGFPALVRQTLRWLAGSESATQSSASWVGDAREFSLSAADASVRGPDGLERGLEFDGRSNAETGAARTARFTATRQLGLYELHASEDGEDAVLSRFSVQVDPRESDTRSIAKLPPPPDEGAVPVRGRTPRWRELLALALFAMVVESWLRLRSMGASGGVSRPRPRPE